MDILRAIELDHEKMLDLLSALKDTTARAVEDRESLFDDLKDLALSHMEAEEQLFYPFVEEEGTGRELTLAATEQHRACRAILADVDSTPFADERWGPKLRVLDVLLEHHIEEEQDRVFEKAQDMLDDERAEHMGERFRAIKKEAQQLR